MKTAGVRPLLLACAIWTSSGSAAVATLVLETPIALSFSRSSCVALTLARRRRIVSGERPTESRCRLWKAPPGGASAAVGSWHGTGDSATRRCARQLGWVAPRRPRRDRRGCREDDRADADH